MLSLLTGFWEGCKSLIGLVFPIFAKARASKGVSIALRWTIHVVLVVLILIGLYFLNRLLIPPGFVRGTLLVQLFFLPILFLLLYALAWLGWWLWKLLTEEEVSRFPDIDEAWEEAVAALEQEGIDLKELPLFLVLGQPAAGEQALFKAAQLPWIVEGAPNRPESPLHIYADDRAIYVTCAKACLLGRRVAALAPAGRPVTGEPFAEGPAAEDDDPMLRSLAGGEVFGSLRGKSIRKVQALLASARRQGGTGGDFQSLSAGDRQALYAQLQGKGGRAYTRDDFEAERLTARLEHLCQLIVRDRRPYCPINGILALIPFAAAGNDAAADRTADDFRNDLDTARRILKVHCPVVTLVCDMEKAEGFRQFIEGFIRSRSAEHLKGRLGKSFPLVPDVSGSALHERVGAFVDWICDAHVPSLLHRLFRLEDPAGPDLKEVMEINTGLYRFLNEVHERRTRLGRIISRSLPEEKHGPPMFGGCYFAGTGRDKDREQAFIPGIFRRLVEDQNYVAWTDDALTEEANYQRWATVGYVMLGVFGLAALVIVGWWLFASGKR